MKTILAVLLVLCFCGCAAPSTPGEVRAAPLPRDPTQDWLKGKLTCLQDGSVLEFRIQKKFAWGGSATGGVAAIHPKTGERFTGQYTAMMQSSDGHSQLILPSGRSVYGNTHVVSRNANAIASLSSTNGTTIQLSMEILAGFTPHGIGQGQDNTGRQYQVQF
jgi:hypothetical protein